MSQRRRTVCFAIVAIGIGGLSVLVGYMRAWRPFYAGGVGRLSGLSNNGSPEHRARIDSLISAIQSETLEQSCKRLYESTDQYFYPGYTSGKKAHQLNLEVMLSNRRSVKVIEELVQLSDEVRDIECEKRFDQLLGVHTSALRAACRHAEDASAPKNEQSLKSTQLALCAVMFATAKAASTRLLVSQCDALAALRIEIERTFAEQGKRYPADFVLAARRYVTPDNRFRLNVLLLHAERLANEALSEAIQQYQASYPKAEVAICGWAAATTQFDVVYRMEGVPIDQSKGVQEYTLFDWPEDKFYDTAAQQQIVDALLEQVRSIP